jgi:hypothetical protein
MTQPRLKKSETLEIRLPYPTKLAFMARCRDQGSTASEALRGFIESAVEGRRRRRAARNLIARQAASAAEFTRLDTNHDGVITYAEFSAATARR